MNFHIWSAPYATGVYTPSCGGIIGGLLVYTPNTNPFGVYTPNTTPINLELQHLHQIYHPIDFRFVWHHQKDHPCDLDLHNYTLTQLGWYIGVIIGGKIGVPLFMN